MTGKIKKLWGRYRQIITYGATGIFATVANYGTFELLHIQAGVNENAANAVAVTLAVLVAYITNKIFVFKTKCKNAKDLMREILAFFGARGATMVIEVAGLYLLVTKIGLNARLSKLGLTVIVIILNFFMSKRFVFKTTADASRSAKKGESVL